MPYTGDAKSTDALGWLLHQLLAVAFGHLAEGAPVVVEVEGRTAGLVHPWPRVSVDDVGQLANAVHEQLAKGPVLVLPPWDEPRNSQPAGGARLGHVLPAEGVLLECRLARPGSLLAAMTPDSTFISERARKVRESLAAYWEPVAVLYATGGVPGVHPSFTVAVAVFRARQREPPVLRIFRIPDAPDPGAVLTQAATTVLTVCRTRRG